MSASSLLVTCGIETQLRAGRARDLLDARERLALDRAELREVELRPRRQRERRRAAPARGAARQRTLDEMLHVFARDRARSGRSLQPCEVDAELARETPNRRTRVHGARRPGLSRTPAAGCRRSGRRLVILSGPDGRVDGPCPAHATPAAPATQRSDNARPAKLCRRPSP